jgi:phosphate transport system substrate-binding protein
MKTTFSILTIILSLMLLGCKNTNRPGENTGEKEQEVTSGKIIISGAYALSPLVEAWCTEFQKLYPDIQFEVLKTGTGQGLKDIMEGKATLAMLSRELTPDESNDSIWQAPVAHGGVVPVFNPENPFFKTLMANGLNTAQLQEIFTAENPVKWSDYVKNATDKNMAVYTRSDESGAADVFARFLNCSRGDLRGTPLEGDENMVKNIQQNNYSIGFCNLNYAFDLENGKKVDRIQILPLDLNFNGKIDFKEKMADSLYIFQRNIWALKFPRNLCRTLYVVSPNLPEDENKLFLKWILTEGQDYIEKFGFCELNSFEITYKLKTLE